MSTLAHRLKKAREKKGLSQSELARRIGIKPQSVQWLEANPDVNRTKYILDLSSILEVNPRWLQDAAGDMLPVKVGDTPIDQDSFVVNATEYVLIAGYDASVSAGPGSMIAAHPEPLYHNSFRLDWLRSITMTSSDRLAMLRVVGDSMQPTLHHGDYVLVDRSVFQFAHDGLYVLNADGVLSVKRIRRSQSDGLITIISDNPIYPPEQDCNPDQFKVEGRVIWLGRNVG